MLQTLIHAKQDSITRNCQILALEHILFHSFLIDKKLSPIYWSIFNVCVATGTIAPGCSLSEFVECLLLYLLSMAFDFDPFGSF